MTRLSSWFARMLSQGGKEIFLKSVAMALLVYAMSYFRLPKTTCAKITRAMSDFWWNPEKKRKRFIGLVGKNYASQRLKEASVSRTLKI